LTKKVTSQAKLLAVISAHVKRSTASTTGGIKTLQGDVGRILSIKDSVVLIEGLNNVKLNELVEFKIKRLKSQGPLLGVALNLEYNVVKALTFVMKKFCVQVF
jgi:F0F1-type ATP synthase alpha subunit